MQGRLQVYTGNGKGKTTAALGLAVRAACAGLRVFVGQLMKGRPDSSALCLPARFPGLITLEQYGSPGLLPAGEEPSGDDRARASRGLERLIDAVSSGEFDVVIADEMNVALHMGILKRDHACKLIDSRGPGVELILTGRNAPGYLIEAADLVTEMTEVKHYYSTEGLQARKGIEY